MRIALLALVGLCGCVPFPNRRLYAPRIEGVVLRGGVPVEGAEVQLLAAFVEDASVKTDADGKFAVGPLSELQFTKSLFGDPLYKYELRITPAGEGRYLGLSRSELGAEPAAMRVVCELSRPVPPPRQPHHCATTP